MKVKEVIDAIRQNGYEQIRGSYYLYDNGEGTLNADSLMDGDNLKLVGACAVGQGALNLNIEAMELHAKLQGIKAPVVPVNSIHGFGIGGIIEGWNDDDYLTCEQIADKFEQTYPELLDQEI